MRFYFDLKRGEDMFVVDPNTKTITMYRGDTGELTITATGYTFGIDDRALFTVKNKAGAEIIRTEYEMTNNAFTVEFTNSDTDTCAPDTYEWDVRYVVNPTYDQTTGQIIDGDDVMTPGGPYMLKLLKTVGQI